MTHPQDPLFPPTMTNIEVTADSITRTLKRSPHADAMWDLLAAALKRRFAIETGDIGKVACYGDVIQCKLDALLSDPAIVAYLDGLHGETYTASPSFRALAEKTREELKTWPKWKSHQMGCPFGEECCPRQTREVE